MGAEKTGASWFAVEKSRIYSIGARRMTILEEMEFGFSLFSSNNICDATIIEGTDYIWERLLEEIVE